MDSGPANLSANLKMSMTEYRSLLSTRHSLFSFAMLKSSKSHLESIKIH